MEILNNIWMALSTPNENLTNILVSLLTFLENFLIMKLFISIFNIKTNKKEQAKYVVFLTLFFIFSKHIIPNPFNVFINYVLNVVLILYLFKLSVLKSILVTFSAAIIYGLIGSLFVNPYLTILKISTEQLSSVPIYRLGYLIISY